MGNREGQESAAELAENEWDLVKELWSKDTSYNN